MRIMKKSSILVLLGGSAVAAFFILSSFKTVRPTTNIHRGTVIGSSGTVWSTESADANNRTNISVFYKGSMIINFFQTDNKREMSWENPKPEAAAIVELAKRDFRL